MVAKAKITLAPSITVPLDKLVVSDANVRKIKRGISIEQLAEDIARRSLLQSLSVRPVLDADGNETGSYEVQGGQRRLRALQLLVKQKRLAKNAPVPCIVKTTGIAEDDSLAENTSREALHPLDQFRAFAALRDKGMGEEDIAAAYTVSSTVVRQRLKLASASPKLLEAYAEDELNLDQLMAFCVAGDHKRQEQVLEAILQRQTSANPYTIRRLLTETCIAADDPRAVFVGVDAYRAAGGEIEGELFDDNGGWLQEPALLMRLATEKLEAARRDVLAQGWKWAEAALENSYSLKQGLDRLIPVSDDLSGDDQATYAALSQEYDALADQKPMTDEISQRMAAIEDELAELDNRPAVYAPEDIARAGAILAIGANGRLSIEYGFVRLEDLPPGQDDADEPGEHDTAAETYDAQSFSDAGDDDGMTTPLPDRLVQDLTAFRTIALRDALAHDFSVAFLAVLHAMCLQVFHRFARHTCLQIETKTHFPATAAELADMAAAKAVGARQGYWAGLLPRQPGELWSALAALADDERAALFAHCASLTVNAVREPHQPRRDAIRHADTLASALSLDMEAAGWATTAANYLGRVTKARILDAVREAKGDDTVRLIEPLKKGDMAKEAERLLTGTGWLPEPLRTPEPAAPSPAQGEESTPVPALPAFLTDSAGHASEGACAPAA